MILGEVTIRGEWCFPAFFVSAKYEFRISAQNECVAIFQQKMNKGDWGYATTSRSRWYGTRRHCLPISENIMTWSKKRPKATKSEKNKHK